MGQVDDVLFYDERNNSTAVQQMVYQPGVDRDRDFLRIIRKMKILVSEETDFVHLFAGKKGDPDSARTA